MQDQYKTFIRSYQKFHNETIKQWINDQIDTGTFIYQNPVIDLIPQYKLGNKLSELVDNGLIHTSCLDIFYNKGHTGPIDPYTHQVAAIQKTVGKKENTIVSTGTGSGKSMCFWIPIVSYCLNAKDKSLKGIKAIVIYPMNA